MRFWKAAALLPLFLAACATTGAGSRAGREILATVGRETIDRAYYEQAQSALAMGGDAGHMAKARPLMLRKLAEIKLLAGHARSAFPARADGIRASTERERRKSLAALFEERRIASKVKVSETEIDRRYKPPLPKWALDEYIFPDARSAQLYWDNSRQRPETYQGSVQTIRHDAVLQSFRGFPPGFAAALPSLAAGDWYGPEAFGGSFFIFRVAAVLPPAAEEKAAQREGLRRQIADEKTAARRLELLDALERRHDVHRTEVVADLAAGKRTFDSLKDDEVLATIDSRPVTRADFRREIEAVEKTRRHQIKMEKTLVGLLNAYLTELVEAEEARDLRLGEDDATVRRRQFAEDLQWNNAFNEETVTAMARPTAAEIEAYYREHESDFPKGLPGSEIDVMVTIMRKNFFDSTKALVERLQRETSVIFHVDPDAF